MKRLVGECTAFIMEGSKEVFLGVIEKLNHEKVITKNFFGKNCPKVKKIVKPSFKFSVKFGDTIEDIYLRSNEFGNPTDWYRLKNLEEGWANKILLESDNIQVANGEIINETFEACIEGSKDFSKYPYISLVSKGMSEVFSQAREELRRNLSVCLGKKTSKLVPGGRYDTETESLIYLGKFLSRRSSEKSSEFNTNSTPTDYAYLFVDYSEDLANNSGTVSELIKKCSIVKRENTPTLIVRYASKSMVFVDSVVQDDLGGSEDFSLFYESVIKNSEIKNENPSWPALGEYGYIFNILSLNKDLNDYTKYESIISPIINRMIEIGLGFLYSDGKQYKKVSELRSLLISMFSDINQEKTKYYTEFFNTIDLDNKIKDVLSWWSPDLLKVDFDFYLKNRFMCRYIRSIIRTETASYYDYGKETISMQIKNSSLKNLIIKICSDYINTEEELYGVRVSQSNIGTQKNPILYTNMYIDLDNIVNYFGGINNIPEEVKKGLMETSFGRIVIQFDEDSVIE